MRRITWSLISVAMLCVFGCGESPEIRDNDDAISWYSMLSDAGTLSSLVGGAAAGDVRLFSSSAGNCGVALTGFSPNIYGDLDHGSFLEVRDFQGGVEATLAKMDGPGVITWMWSANPVGELVLEIDGKQTIYPFGAFLSGKWLPVRNPYAAKTAGGYNLHFPILHKNSCRVLIRAKSRAELGAMFYQIAWNAIDADRDIESFILVSMKGNKAGLKRLSLQWMEPLQPALSDVLDAELVPGASCKAVAVSGEGTIRSLGITAGSKSELANLYVEMFWDGASLPLLACPLYMLCGVSERFENVRALPVSVNGKTVVLRWAMPFKDGGLIRLSNMGDSSVRLRVAVSVESKCESSLRFGGDFSTHRNIRADKDNLLNLARIPGSGKIVGCIVQVENHGDGWWGEGDPVIWLNREDRPAWRGTGSEDYFGFAWCSTSRFQHPLRGQTRANQSFAAMYRYHLLDVLPFKQWARFDFEVHGTEAGSLDYFSLVLWYSSTNSMKDWNELR